MDASVLTERKVGEQHHHPPPQHLHDNHHNPYSPHQQRDINDVDEEKYQTVSTSSNITTNTISTSNNRLQPDKHRNGAAAVADDHHDGRLPTKKRAKRLISFVFSVYTATLFFAVLITFTCAFLVVRIQELEVFLNHQDGYIRELRNQFKGLKGSAAASNRIPPPSSSMQGARGSVSRHLLATGEYNCDCPPGPKGEQGPRGERGRQGAPGREGNKGSRGDAGRHGRDGSKGDKGYNGDIGLRGQKGDRGEKGTRGRKGNQGDVGEKGLPGVNGTTVVSNASGRRGTRGNKGELGPRGEKGSKGEKGIAGELVGVQIKKLLEHRVKAIHLQGLPDNGVTGISRLDAAGAFNQWRTCSNSDMSTFTKDWDGNITVNHRGQYLIYSRVLFYDSSAFYGANTNINDQVFQKCGGARASAAVKFGPCQSIGVAQLNAGDRVGITSVYPNIDVEMSPESTYFGMIKIN